MRTWVDGSGCIEGSDAVTAGQMASREICKTLTTAAPYGHPAIPTHTQQQSYVWSIAVARAPTHSLLLTEQVSHSLLHRWQTCPSLLQSLQTHPYYTCIAGGWWLTWATAGGCCGWVSASLTSSLRSQNLSWYTAHVHGSLKYLNTLTD